MSVYRPDHHFQAQWLDVERCYPIFLHPAVTVNRSVWGLSMKIGVLYLPLVMLVPVELIVCSTRGFVCVLAK